ncbi:hypothetical protein SAMN02745945_01785 [Peptoclostridium litorale DSM 5388]|uniref:Phosphoribosyltransferase domain-containing protein n=1 Tax=Peptoclostridium litorale DSM 5388 TaxID=1121324 RepID=A0A069RP39_PEPLI|nr:phosphoribosyltransferase [Peptoclostridium litorale]KDR95942.1 hypothetical protein CLIT_8c01110 [Peptoclostridium litorale DSM 5388]SIO09523.1 hypothetical protein SAMN02745945_01785 [Peptoclostridium litorale DSM 5388]
MKKIFILSADCIENLKYKEEMINTIKELTTTDENKVLITSHDETRLSKLKDNLQLEPSSNFAYANRHIVNNFIEDKEKSYFAVLGNKTVDMRFAARNKLLFLSPTWTVQDDDAKKYGIPIDNPDIFYKFAKTLNNQNHFFTKMILPDETRVFSIMDARHKAYAKNLAEKDLVENFERILKKKQKNRTYFEILLYHFLATISNNNPLFSTLDDWCIAPSSGQDLNRYMLYFKEVARCMMGKQNPRSEAFKDFPNMFIRHTLNSKSQNMNSNTRIQNGCISHFDTICINKIYKKKLKNRNIIIFDDYLTHGNTFESLRNLLRSQGVGNIVLVTLGSFCSSYKYQEYDIMGDVFSPGYKYKLNRKEIVTPKNFIEAKDEISNLYDIFNLGQ